MSSKRKVVKTRSQLEQLLNASERRLKHLELQKAKFGELYVPAHIQIEIEDEKKKIASLKRQITRLQRSNILFRVSQFFDTASRVLDDIALVFSKSSRKPKRIRHIQRKITFFTLGVVIIAATSIYLIVTKNTLSSQPPTLTQDSVDLSQPKTSSVQSDLETQSNSIPLVTPNSNLQTAIIVNTGGIGVRYRSEPRYDSPFDAGPSEGDIVYLIERITNSYGEIWWKVQLTDGRIGYVLERYIQER